jgi:hypothetical protein
VLEVLRTLGTSLGRTAAHDPKRALGRIHWLRMSVSFGLASEHEVVTDRTFGTRYSCLI